jgi:preprotein translocase subunit YajC
MNVQIILPLLLIVAVYYFLLVRPRQQESKRQTEMVASLSPGTEIMTIGGIFGRVVEVGEERVRIATADDSEFEIAKRAVARVVPAEESAADDAESPEVHPDGDEPPVAPLSAEQSAENSADEGAEAQDVEPHV